MSIDYLKPEQYYVDIYDLSTIRECLRTIEFWRKAYKEHFNDPELKSLTDEKKEHDFGLILGRHLFVVKTSEYKGKKEFIQKLMSEDKAKQAYYDNAIEPKNVICTKCTAVMKYSSKILEDYMDTPMRVCFMFDCPACKKRQAIYDNGEVYIPKPNLCPKCGKEVKVTTKVKDKVITWTTKCNSCGYKNVDIDDFSKKDAERAKEEAENKALLEKYRAEFCLDDKKGQEDLDTIEALEYSKFAHDDEMKKYDNPVYEQVSKIKKLGIGELEKLLAPLFEKQGYVKFSLDKPEMGQFVIVPFSFQETETHRNKRESMYDLQKLIKDILEETNWRLTTEGLSNRLGFITGKLKGYEREEDLITITGKIKEEPNPITDPNKRSHLELNNIVQLARHMGHFEAVENIRKRRLEKEPEGFFLEVSDGGNYTCGICGRSFAGDKIWWNLDGLRCADCWKNIKEGVIPHDLKHEYDGDNQWVPEWQFQSDYGIHPATRDKYVRQGILKARQLKDAKGYVYYKVFLVDENKEFLKDHPKRPKGGAKLKWSEEKHAWLLWSDKKEDKS